MPRRTSRYSASVNNDLEIRILVIINASEDAMSIQQIQREDITLANYTSQKLARVLGKLIEMGFVRKSKSKSGRMMYKSVSVMLRQGYSVDQIYELQSTSAAEVPLTARLINWEVDEERKEEKNED